MMSSVMSNPDHGYELRTTTDKGEGVFALRDFKRGSLVSRGSKVKDVQNNYFHATQVGVDKFIVRSIIAQKVNHSCDPNVGYRDSADGGMDYYAFKDIKSGEEIVGDYAMGNYQIEHMPACLCGSTSCRTSITGWKDLPQHVKQEYTGFHAAYLSELDKLNE